MICSMTGFGQANCSFAGYNVFIDVKSVNHRYSEVSIRLPKEWAAFEDALKKTGNQQKAFCEKHAHKTGEMIDSIHLEYEEDYKAIASKG